MPLDFGLLYELVTPKPHGPRTEYEYLQGALEDMVLAEELGYTHVWMPEHHFLEEYAHSTAPDAVLGAIARSTSKIRIGFGVKLMPFGYNHPVRNAEMVATMDLVSNGRVEVGTGRGATVQEIAGFNVDPAKSRAEWEEGTRIMVAAWNDKPLEWDSPTMKVPSRNVIPKPIQDPHPPLWVAATSQESHQVAGSLGLGCLSFSLATPIPLLGENVKIYKDAIANADPIGRFVNDNIGVYVHVHVAETDEQAEEEARAGLRFHLDTVGKYFARLKDWTANRHIPSYEYVQAIEDNLFESISVDSLYEQGIPIIGSVETCIERVRAYQDIGIDQLIGAHDMWGLGREKIRKSLELFGKHVIPEFR